MAGTGMGGHGDRDVTRHIKREDAAERAARLSQLRDATPAQIETYVRNNATDLQGAQDVLIELAVLVSVALKRASR